MRNPHHNLLRILCACWASAWGLVWVAMTVVSLLPRIHGEPSDALFRTGALLSAWAGLFAWKALQPPDGPRNR